VSFPDGFLWGTATSAHQVEGGNVYNDSWLAEHLPGSHYAEPSGDACDHYHRYESDIALIAGLGLGAYRFSLEWSRIEPEDGEFSRAALDHYRRMLDACHEHGLTPFLTFHHFTSPRWIAAAGGWEERRTAERFARFCERAMRHLGDLVPYACTLNEPNLGGLLHGVLGIPAPRPGCAGSRRTPSSTISRATSSASRTTRACAWARTARPSPRQLPSALRWATCSSPERSGRPSGEPSR